MNSLILQMLTKKVIGKKSDAHLLASRADSKTTCHRNVYTKEGLGCVQDRSG